VIVPEFQEHLVNDNIIAAISFLESRRNNKWLDEAREEGAGMLLVAKNWCYFCSSVSNEGGNFVEVYCMFKASPRIHSHVP
jgi:hypothetical protein